MHLWILCLAMAAWFEDDNFSLAGLTQESHDVDIETISSDDEPVDPEVNFRLLLEGERALSNNVSQVSNFDDKIFQLSHGSNTQNDRLEDRNDSSGYFSNSMASSTLTSVMDIDVSLKFL